MYIRLYIYRVTRGALRRSCPGLSVVGNGGTGCHGPLSKSQSGKTDPDSGAWKFKGHFEVKASHESGIRDSHFDMLSF